MRFQVPQFIEVEDKIFGPLTWKQFLYVAGGGGLTLGIFTLLSNHKLIAFIISAPIVALSLALAFIKINNRPFIIYLESVLSYFSGERLYIWKKESKKPEATNHNTDAYKTVALPHLSESKLKDMSWSLDVSKDSPPKKDSQSQ
jgi:hypothetical protein